jgi:hypothetical protein
MATINQLPLLGTLEGGDQLVLWSMANGDTRRLPYSDFKADVLASPDLTGTVTIGGLTVTIGANDSGGTGFRVLRVPNA